MNNYELTIVLPGKSKSKEKAVSDKIEKIVKTLDGKVKKAESWGEIELAYKIEKENSGFFIHYILELNGKAAKNINDKLRVERDIIRYLLVSAE